jgi:hypothetical protein
MKNSILIILVSIIFLGNSCQVLYEDNSVIAEKGVIVVEGMVTTDSGPYIVKLSKAVKFSNEVSKNKNSDPIIGAIVSIADNGKNKEILKETLKGTYITDYMGLLGTIGHSYQLFVKTKEGDEYESDVCLMHGPGKADSIYAEPTEIISLGRDAHGKYVQQIQKGINIYIDAQPNGEFYFKTELDVMEQIIIYHNTGTSANSINWNFIYGLFYIEDQSVNVTGSIDNSTNIVKKFKSGLIPDINYEYLHTDRSAPEPVKSGYAVTCKVKTISKKSFLFFKYMQAQLNAQNSLFDPISTQLTGNIHCVSDSSKLVLGYFDAAPVTRKYIYFKWIEGKTKLFQKSLNYYPPLFKNRIDTGKMPPQWIVN